MNTEHSSSTLSALVSLAQAAVAELHDLRDPDPLARELGQAARQAALTIEKFWLPELKNVITPP